VRTHLQRLVTSGLVLAYLADEAGVPRSTVYGIWRGAGRTAPATAAALLALRPLRVADVLPTEVRDCDALTAGAGRAGHRAAVAGLDLHRDSAQRLAERLGVSARTVQRWRAAQAAATETRGA
jgi:transcriptional regulator with XRE-family HTH domain